MTDDKLHATDEHGDTITVPRLPIERAGLPIPGYVTRPDGVVVWVEERKTD